MKTRQVHTGYVNSPRVSDGFVLRDLVRLIIDNLWVVIGITVATVVLAGAYAIFAAPLYSADALVQVEVPKQNELAQLVSKQMQSSPSPNAPPTNTEMAIIRSRAVLAPVISQNGLDIVVTPRRFPVLGKLAASFATPGTPSRAWLGLSSFAWGGEELGIAQLNVPIALQDKKLELKVLDNRHFQLFDPDGKLLAEGEEGQLAQAGDVSILVNRLVAPAGVRFTVERLNEVTAVDLFAPHLKIAEIGKETGIVQISFEDRDSAVATAVTNSIARNYVAAHLTRDQQEASKMLAFINGELPSLRDNLKRAEGELQKHRITSSSMQASTESQSYLQGSIEFSKQIAALNLQRTELLDRFTAHSPEVKTVDAQLAELHAAQDKFEGRFNAMPEADRESADLTRDAKVAEDIYVAMLNKAHELSVSRAGTVGNVNVIDTAVEPSTPVKPQRGMAIAVAPVPGFFLGVLFVIARRYLSQSVSEPEQIETRLRLKMLGAVPFSSEQANLELTPALLGAPAALAQRAGGRRALAPPYRPNADALLAVKCPNDPAIEGLRRIRTMLDSTLVTTQDRVVMVTGATPSTGKTFVAANLAVLCAQAGKRVLLIDSDLRRGRLGALFGLPHATGLAELLTGDASLENTVYRTSVPHLSLLPAGMHPDNPSELLAMEQMRKLLDHFNEHYDLVLFDTPPVLAVTDALIVTRHAGATVLVLRENAQTEQEVEETLKHLDSAGALIAGAVFNGMSPRRSDRRSYEYIHAYANETKASVI
ncbi:polysaccharide biosynthesis tyrosine autokinase [Paraburkholderia ginsengisoli]|uniref:Putative tyrosine-protein kinase EpsB n=1 Tax=Paraburkholderia ginsengisoli TaxID=311231 RepID=A0A7T4TC63_9BURK|nr:polysaccharide biosynthesis tyrosine autokinase [Paraburkholderia ginsengisoli]QQC67293.1 polysaccharide biosynthesis tyrosine autokinase [Paraburkholderia ginsengisoli]